MHTNATLHLDFTVEGNQTILRVPRQDPPLRVIRAFPIEAENRAMGHQIPQPVLVHMNNISGGLLGGDQLRLEAHVGPDAQVQLTTTGSTRVYRRRRGHPTTTQTTQITVDSGGLLEYLPDTLIPYSRSCYRQTTEIRLAPDSGLFYWEIVTPGREAKGECFDYDMLQIDLDILADDRPIAIERSRLEPNEAEVDFTPMESLTRMGAYRYFAVFYICRIGVEKQRWLDLEQELDQVARRFSERGQAQWGVSTLAEHGLSLRAVGVSSHALQQQLPAFWQLAKQALYQQDAVMPRKVY